MNSRINDIYQLAYFDVAVRGNQAWFCNYSSPAICRMDLQSHKVALETFIPEQETRTLDLYGPIALYKDILILAPRNAKQILLYDLSRKIFREIRISMDVMETRQRHRLFMEIAVMGDIVYLLPARYPAIVKLDMTTLGIKYYDTWYQELKMSLTEPEKFIFGRPFVRNEHECMFPVWQNNSLVQVNLETGEYVIHRVPDIRTCLSAVTFDGDNYWIASKDKNMLLKWEEKKHFVVYDAFPNSFKMSGDCRFVALECIGEEIIAIPKYGSGNMIVAVNYRTGASRTVTGILTEPMPHLKESALGRGLILCSKKTDKNRLIIFSDFDGKTLDINLESGTCIEFETVLEKEERGLYIQQILFGSSGKTRIEEQGASLKEYVEYMNLCAQSHKKTRSHPLSGNKIFKAIRSNLLI